ncbi:hypothetical protein M405DRAFT_807749 [Rhizopogon salebrosus TDB-379]|nr:hypothetical protein M405DRAFT_807749 [Rhizopogon salebrosus TDB-379]
MKRLDMGIVDYPRVPQLASLLVSNQSHTLVWLELSLVTIFIFMSIGTVKFASFSRYCRW